MLICSYDDMEEYLVNIYQDEELNICGENLKHLYGPRKTFCLLWNMRAQIFDGGLEGYFSNNCREDVVLCSYALNSIGAFKAGNFLATAMAILANDKFWQAHSWGEYKALRIFDDEREKLTELDEDILEFDDDLIENLFSSVVAAGKDF